MEATAGRSTSRIRELASSSNLLAALIDGECSHGQCGDVELFRISGETSIESAGVMTGEYMEVVVEGDYAYLVSGLGGIDIVLVETESEPVVIGHIDPIPYGSDPGLTTDIDIEGDRAYVAAGLSGLAIYGIAQPWAPVLINTSGFRTANGNPEYIMNVAVAGDTLVMATSESIVRYNLIDGDLPAQAEDSGRERIGVRSPYWSLSSLEVQGDRAFYTGWVSDWITFWALGVIDLSQQSEIEEIGVVTLRGAFAEAVFSDRHATLATAAAIVSVDTSKISGHIGEVTGGTVPGAIVGSVSAGPSISTVHVQGSHAFVFRQNSVQAFQVKGDSFVDLLTEIASDGFPAYIDGNEAVFVVERSRDDNTQTLLPLDLSNPEQLKWLGEREVSWPVAGDGPELKCPGNGLGNTCYSSTTYSPDGPYVINISSPRGDLPAKLVPASSTGNGFDLTIGDDHIFVVAGTSVYIYDAANPESPELKLRQPLDVQLSDGDQRVSIAYENGILFVLLEGLWVFDASTPAEPQFIGHYDFDGVRLGVDGGLVVMADRSGNLQAVKLNSPSTP